MSYDVQSPSDSRITKRRVRTTDDVELIKIILDDLPDLKKKVLRFIERTVGKKGMKTVGSAYSPAAVTKNGRKAGELS